MTKPPFARILIANRGEIAIRIARACAELGVPSVAVFAEDEAEALHVRRADDARPLPGRGARAYLDPAALVAAATAAGCDAVHPGYGFLSESAAFAQACQDAGLTFIGPSPEQLSLFGDKLSARALAARLDVPLLPGSDGAVDADGALALFDALPEGAALVIKAVAGGGGRGMRVVNLREDVAQAHARCASEAASAFGDGSLYAERFLPQARHIEVQVIGDGTGACLHLHERDCTLQRRHQKVLEIAPAPGLTQVQRDRLTDHALRLAKSADYRGLGTFEFLATPDAAEVFFIEANPRVQVEHTVTEEVLGLDLVALQIRVCAGESLADLGLTQDSVPAPQGFAVQARVNLERMDETGAARPSLGRLTRWEPPTGPGLRVDSHACAGWEATPAYDSLLAKVIAHSRAPDLTSALRKTERALGELRVEGVETNADWLRALLRREEVQRYQVSTRFIEAHAADLAAEATRLSAARDPGAAVPDAPARKKAAVEIPADATALAAPLNATVFSLPAPGTRVRRGETVAVLEAMKMEHAVDAPFSGEVAALHSAVGDTLAEGAPVLSLRPLQEAEDLSAATEARDMDFIRPELEELRERLFAGEDMARPDRVAKRRGTGKRTARENLEDLADPGSFLEYGALVLAAQAARRSTEELIRDTTGDGVVTGTGTINARAFGPDRSRAAFCIYDYMVMAGTQGQRHHRKLDRIFELAEADRLPFVLLPEGGGGRPGETERRSISGLDGPSFARFGALSGKVPLVGMVTGRCFAGNAAILGCCDTIIADETSNIGMAGPAMIEGGGLGRFSPEEIGPIESQAANGVVDLRVKDEAEGCAAARKYIAYFQGDLSSWTAPDQRRLRHAMPENRLRAHDVREVIEAMSDEGSVMELRRDFGLGMVTALVRIEGRPFGLIANDCRHLGGAIDGPAADKAARFMQLCDAHGLPILSLIDTPGFMVGPEAEETALVRHVSRMFVVAAALTVPLFAIILRKSYGLGAMAMAGGGFREARFTVSWPTGEFGGMGLEGAVHLGYRKELEALENLAERQALYDRLVAEHYAVGKAVRVATTDEIDAVIDPIDTRAWALSGLANARARPGGVRGSGRFVDPW